MPPRPSVFLYLNEQGDVFVDPVPATGEDITLPHNPQSSRDRNMLTHLQGAEVE